jgi:hypothetical protein
MLQSIITKSLNSKPTSFIKLNRHKHLNYLLNRELSSRIKYNFSSKPSKYKVIEDPKDYSKLIFDS